MRSITQPLRDEHKNYLPCVMTLRDAADLIGEASYDVILQKVDSDIDFLLNTLLPHFSAEDRVLYPIVARIMDSPQATNTMRMDHAEMRLLVAELANLRAKMLDEDCLQQHQKQLYRVLYSLYTLVVLHFSKEEDIYFSIVDDHLTSEEGRLMLDDMGIAEDSARPELMVYVRHMEHVSLRM